MSRFPTVNNADVEVIIEDKNTGKTKKATKSMFNDLIAYYNEKCTRRVCNQRRT